MNSSKRIPVNTIAIVGGTHGNERTAIELLRYWKSSPQLLKRPSLRVTTLLANPAATASNCRYIDRDLNRCFAPETLGNSETNLLEEQLAQQINQKLGPRGSDNAPDLCLDIHNTSANMGISLIFNLLDPYMEKLLAYLAANEPLVRLYYQPLHSTETPFLPSIGKRDLTIDAGPQHHGTLSADIYQRVEQLVQEILDFTEAWNSPSFQEPPPRELELFTEVENVEYPLDAEGRIAAMIHPGVEGMDYHPLPPGAPLFLGFDGTIHWSPYTEQFWPVFINEQAYYEKGIAMTLTRRTVVKW